MRELVVTPTITRVSGVKNGFVLRDSGVDFRAQRTRVATQHKAIPAASQKGQAPAPGPRSGTQPIFSSALFTMIVMTIIVAFILEAFLFRIQYKNFFSKEEGEELRITMRKWKL